MSATGSHEEASCEDSGGDGRGGDQYHCDYCRKDITRVVRIKCAECEDFDLCLECFSSGVEVFPHRNFHSYRVMDHVTTPIFEVGWGADEELLLLEGIEMFGFGNWGEVADRVGRKTKEECEAHYHNIYLNSATSPLPDLTAPLRPPCDTVEEEKDKTKLVSKVKTKPKVKGTPATPQSKPFTEQIGYAEKRAEFDTEYENDAELILADMEFREEDTKWERELKLKVVEIYNTKLDARLERKKFILERGLLYKKECKRTKEEQEIYNNMKVFARFHSAEEHEAFVQGLANELRLRKRIEQLQNYRLNGIRTLAEAEEFEKTRKDEGKKKAESAAPRKRTDTDENDALKKKSKEKPDDALDLAGVEGVELLSEQERSLCSQLGLIPQHYMIIKDRLVRESFTRGFLQPGQARQLIKIDVQKTDKIVDFLVSVGWVHAIPDEPKPAAPSLPYYPQTSFPQSPYATTSVTSSSRPFPQYQFAPNLAAPASQLPSFGPGLFPTAPFSSFGAAQQYPGSQYQFGYKQYQNSLYPS